MRLLVVSSHFIVYCRGNLALYSGAPATTIFTEQWYTAWPVMHHVAMDDWEQLHLIRDEVNKALEETRQQGVIGSPLAADVTLYASEQQIPKLSRLGESYVSY